VRKWVTTLLQSLIVELDITCHWVDIVIDILNFKFELNDKLLNTMKNDCSEPRSSN